MKRRRGAVREPPRKRLRLSPQPDYKTESVLSVEGLVAVIREKKKILPNYKIQLKRDWPESIVPLLPIVRISQIQPVYWTLVPFDSPSVCKSGNRCVAVGYFGSAMRAGFRESPFCLLCEWGLLSSAVKTGHRNRYCFVVDRAGELRSDACIHQYQTSTYNGVYGAVPMIKRCFFDVDERRGVVYCTDHMLITDRTPMFRQHFTFSVICAFGVPYTITRPAKQLWAAPPCAEEFAAAVNVLLTVLVYPTEPRPVRRACAERVRELLPWMRELENAELEEGRTAYPGSDVKTVEVFWLRNIRRRVYRHRPVFRASQRFYRGAFAHPLCAVAEAMLRRCSLDAFHSYVGMRDELWKCRISLSAINCLCAAYCGRSYAGLLDYAALAGYVIKRGFPPDTELVGFPEYVHYMPRFVEECSLFIPTDAARDCRGSAFSQMMALMITDKGRTSAIPLLCAKNGRVRRLFHSMVICTLFNIYTGEPIRGWPRTPTAAKALDWLKDFVEQKTVLCSWKTVDVMLRRRMKKQLIDPILLEFMIYWGRTVPGMTAPGESGACRLRASHWGHSKSKIPRSGPWKKCLGTEGSIIRMEGLAKEIWRHFALHSMFGVPYDMGRLVGDLSIDVVRHAASGGPRGWFRHRGLQLRPDRENYYREKFRSLSQRSRILLYILEDLYYRQLHCAPFDLCAATADHLRRLNRVIPGLPGDATDGFSSDVILAPCCFHKKSGPTRLCNKRGMMGHDSIVVRVAFDAENAGRVTITGSVKLSCGYRKKKHLAVTKGNARYPDTYYEDCLNVELLIPTIQYEVRKLFRDANAFCYYRLHLCGVDGPVPEWFAPPPRPREPGITIDNPRYNVYPCVFDTRRLCDGDEKPWGTWWEAVPQPLCSLYKKRVKTMVRSILNLFLHYDQSPLVVLDTMDRGYVYKGQCVRSCVMCGRLAFVDRKWYRYCAECQELMWS